MDSPHRSATVAVIAFLGLFLADAAGVAQSVGDVPGPVLDGRELPEAAAWPVLRYERPLRMLVVADKRQAMSAYRRIALRLRSRVDYCYVGVDDMVEYHVNDKWIEPKDQPTRDELAKAVLESAVRTTQVQDGQPVADVIVVNGNPAHVLDEPAIAANLLANVRAGAALVVCGSVYPKTESPLAAVWPMKAKPQNSWMGGGATRMPHAALAGVPVSHLAGHQWIPFAEPTEGSTALATGESGSAFLRTVEQGAVVTIPMGPISRHWAAIERLQRRYDHDEIWLRLWDQLLYELVRGDEAFPAYGDLPPVTGETPAGQQAVIEGTLANRTLNGPLAVAVHVTNPLGEVVFRQEETVELAAGAQRSYPVHIPVGADWPSGMYPVTLTVGDAKARRQVHQAMEYLTVAGQVTLSIAADRPGYPTGEQATFTVTGASSQPWQGELALGVYDFRGRLLAVETRPAELATEPREFRFQYRLADHGVRVDTYWAVVVARSKTHVAPSLRDGDKIASRSDASTWEWARAETKVYKHDRWSMRNEYQWSTWAGIACGPPSTVPAGMRLMAHAGMNALGYPGRNELYYPAERWGWRYYNEGIGMNTFCAGHRIRERRGDRSGPAQGSGTVAEIGGPEIGRVCARFRGRRSRFQARLGHALLLGHADCPGQSVPGVPVVPPRQVSGGGRFERGLENQLRVLGRRQADPRVLGSGPQARSRRLGAPQGLAAGLRRDGRQPVALCRYGRVLQLVLRSHRGHRAADLARADQPGNPGDFVGADHRLRRIRRAAGRAQRLEREPMALDRRRARARLRADLGPFRLVRENRQHVLGIPADAQRPQQLLGGRAADVQQRLDPHAVVVRHAAVDAPAGRPRADHPGQPACAVRGRTARPQRRGPGQHARQHGHLAAGGVVAGRFRLAGQRSGETGRVQDRVCHRPPGGFLARGGASAALRGWRRHAGLHAAVCLPDGSPA